MPSASERRQLNNELRRLGFGDLNDPNLNVAIAYYIKNHEMFRNQLFSVAPDKRKLAYDQLRPHLRFSAKPLDVYEAEMKQQAEAKQLPTIREGQVYPEPYKPGEVGLRKERNDIRIERKLETVANKAVEREHSRGSVYVVCTNCLRGEAFYGDTAKLATKEAYSDGWRIARDEAPMCPDCIEDRRS